MIGFLWDTLLMGPMINGLIVLSQLLFGSFGLAIIAFTVIVRLITLPLTLRQLRSSRQLMDLQPRLQEIQKKYKDPRRRSEETMKLYKEAGVNPLGCLVPLLVQFPIWIALYRAIVLLVGTSPENLVSLSQRLYPWSYIQHGVPVDSTFLWLNMGEPDIVLPFLVAASMFVQTKTSTARTASVNPQQQSMNNMMLYTMPLIFGWFSLTVPSGLALYWFATNVIGIGMNYLVFGKESFRLRELFSLSPAPADGRAKRPRRRGDQGSGGGRQGEQPEDGRAGAETVELGGKKRATHGKPRSHRKNRR